MRYLFLAVLLFAVASSAMGADWNAFVIRNSTTGNIAPVITDVEGGKLFAITLGGQKAGWGTNYMNGKKVKDILAVSIYRDPSVVGWGPYMNIWITDGEGGYAILSNEPSHTWEYAGSSPYNTTWNVLKNATSWVYEVSSSVGFKLPNGTRTYVNLPAGTTPSPKFQDFADYTIATPPSHWGGPGAPDDLNAGTYTAYGFNWVFGDTQSNYLAGYLVADPEVVAPVTYKVTPTMLTGVDAELATQPFSYDPDSARPQTKTGAPSGFGGSSFYANVNQSGATQPDRYRTLRIGLTGLFGGTLTIGDIVSMSYQTNKPAPQTAIDWRFSIYTLPEFDGFDRSSWYRDRIQSHPAGALNLNAPADQWNLWSTVTGANQLQFGTNRPGFTSENMLWSAIAGNTTGFDFASEQVMWVDLTLGANSGGGTGESQLDAVRFELVDGAVATLDLSGDTVILRPTDASIYVKPTETVVVDLDVANLTQPVSALQAFLNFSSTYFKSGEGDVNVAAGGGDWETPIWGRWTTGGDLDVSVGVEVRPEGEPQVGTQADATTAIITLQPKAEGITRVVFRADADPDPGLTESTFLSDMDSLPVWPVKIDSTNIYIDGTAPVITCPADYSTSVATQSIAASATDPVSGGVSTGVASFKMNTVAFTSPTTVVLVPGINTFVFEAVDMAGNVATKTLTITYNQPAPAISMPMSTAPNGGGSPSYPAWDMNALTAVLNGLTNLGSGYTEFKAITGPQDYGCAIVTNFFTWKGLVTTDTEYGTRIHAIYKVENGVQGNPGAAKLDLNKLWAKGVNNFVGSDSSGDNGSYTFSDYQVVTASGPFGASTRLKGYNWVGGAWVEVTSGYLADLIMRDFGEGIEPPSGSTPGQATVNTLYKNMSGAVVWPANSEVDASPVIGKRAKLSTMDFTIEYRDGVTLPNASLTQTASLASTDTTPPVIAISSPADGLKTNVAAQTIAGTVTDDEILASGVREVKVYLNSGLVNTYTTSDPVNFSDAVTLVEGNNVITVDAKDFAGNTATKTINVLLDTVKPALGLSDNFGSDPVLQGTYTVTVTASDPSSGLAGAPVMNWGGLDASAGVEDPTGTWTYTVTINSATANGPHTITADISDQAGNAATQVSRTINVNKNQITGTVELQGFVGGTRTVTFVANATLKTWNIPVTFTGAVGSYTLTDVPDGVTALSAKTAWNLRKKNTGLVFSSGQAASNFVLLGGDVNNSNSVNVLDYNVVRLNWFKLGANNVANINGDGAVNDVDYALMVSNWFKVGDPQ